MVFDRKAFGQVVQAGDVNELQVALENLQAAGYLDEAQVEAILNDAITSADLVTATDLTDGLATKLNTSDVLNEDDFATGSTTQPPSQASVATALDVKLDRPTAIAPALLLSPDGSANADGSVSPSVSGTVTTTSGVYGDAWVFTESGDTVSIANNGYLDMDEGTVIVRCQFDGTLSSTAHTQVVFATTGSSRAVRIRRHNASSAHRVRFEIGDASTFIASDANTAPAATPLTLALTWRNGTARAFIDGELIGTTAYDPAGDDPTTLYAGINYANQVYPHQTESALLYTTQISDVEVARISELVGAHTIDTTAGAALDVPATRVTFADGTEVELRAGDGTPVVLTVTSEGVVRANGVALATGEAVPGLVADALADDDTAAQAAAAAVSDALAADETIDDLTTAVAPIQALSDGETIRGTISGVQPRRGAVLSPFDKGGVGDGVTNDYAAIMQAVDAFGDEAGTIDLEGRTWFSAEPLEIDAPISIDGGSSGSTTSNVHSGGMLQFADDVAGLILRKGWRYSALRDLMVRGGGASLGTADGIFISGVRWRMDNVRASRFNRHGIHYNSDVEGSNADLGVATRVHAFVNKGDGIHLAGGADTNACLFEMADATSNGGYGIYNKGNFNTFLLPHADNNTNGDFIQVAEGLSSVWISPYSEGNGRFYIDSNTAGGFLLAPGAFGLPEIWSYNTSSGEYEQTAHHAIAQGWSIPHYEYTQLGRIRLKGQSHATPASREVWNIDPDYPGANRLAIRNVTTGQSMVHFYGDASNPRSIFQQHIEMATGKAITTGDIETLPTAGVAHRGKILRIEGGAGVEDGLYICEKQDDDSYAWRQI